MADELIDIFDENNNPIGMQKMKSEAHRLGLWHRGAHVWIYNSKGEILLQLRARQKKMYPNMWDASAAGHVGAGEGPAETAVREIKEELGLDIRRDDLYFFMIRKSKDKYGQKIDNEFYYAYILRYDGSADNLKLQEEELEDAKFVPINQILEELNEENSNYVPYGAYWQDIIEEVSSLLRK